jgi:hypothetical protein
MSYYNKIYGLLLENRKARRAAAEEAAKKAAAKKAAAEEAAKKAAEVEPKPAEPPEPPEKSPEDVAKEAAEAAKAKEAADKIAARDQYRKELDALPNKDGSPYESPSEYRERMRHNIENMRKRHAIVNPDTGKAPVPYKETAFDRFDAKVGRFNQSVGQVMQSGKNAVADKIRAAKDRVIGLIKRKP